MAMIKFIGLRRSVPLTPDFASRENERMVPIWSLLPAFCVFNSGLGLSTCHLLDSWLSGLKKSFPLKITPLEQGEGREGVEGGRSQRLAASEGKEFSQSARLYPL